MKILVERTPLEVNVPDNFFEMETREKIAWVLKLTGLSKEEIGEWQEMADFTHQGPKNNDN